MYNMNEKNSSVKVIKGISQKVQIGNYNSRIISLHTKYKKPL